MHYAFWHIAVILCDYDVKFVNVSHFNHTVNDKKFLLFLNFINIRSLTNSPSEEFIFISQVSWNGINESSKECKLSLSVTFLVLSLFSLLKISNSLTLSFKLTSQ